MRRLHAGRGFTLVEVVIALTIVSLVLLGLLGALRTFARTADTIEASTSRIEEVSAVSRFLAETGTWLARGRIGGSPQFEPFVAGGGERISWLGVLPARFGGGGVHLFSLGIEDDGGARVLALRFLPYFPGVDPARLADIEPQFRLDHVDAFDVSFEDREGRWMAQWSESEQAPQRISFALSVGGARWPDIVIRPLPVDAARGIGGQIVIGGSNG